MAHPGSPDGYTVNTGVSTYCKEVLHKERDLRRLKGEKNLRLKDISASWLEEMAKKRDSELQVPS